VVQGGRNKESLAVDEGDVLNLLGNEWGASFAVRFENRA